MSNLTNLLEHRRKKCYHQSVFLIDKRSEHIECKECGEQLNPMWVLEELQRRRSRWESRVAKLREEIPRAEKELTSRTRTKCQHCKKMTPIRLRG